MINLSVAILTLPDGRLVFQRRSPDAPYQPNHLALFGGHADQGETPDQTIRREMAEETSLQIEAIDFIILGECERPPTPAENEQRLFTVYQAAIADDNFEVYEGVGNESYTLTEALERNDLASTARAILEKIRSTEWHLA